jgi:heparosan-N-sulfate-glucuronate 5-epimerase
MARVIIRLVCVIYLTYILMVVPSVQIIDGAGSHRIEEQQSKLVRCATDPATMFCDSKGLVYRYYGPDVGIQLNPFSTASKAVDHYTDYIKNGNNTAKKLVLNIGDWIVNSSRNYGNYSVMHYYFPFDDYELEQGWSSAIAQGRAIQALIKAHNMTGDKKYSDTAKLLLNSFFIEVKDGGVTYKTVDDGWWYEEYASKNKNAKGPKILPGMMSALLSIYEYFEYTGDAKAKYLFDKGIVALKKNISSYDNNGNSYYDILGNPAKQKYHLINIELLGRLFDITGEPIFDRYHDKWEENENEPL